MPAPFFLCLGLLTFCSGHPDGASLHSSTPPTRAPLPPFLSAGDRPSLSPQTPTQHHVRERPVSLGPEGDGQRPSWPLVMALNWCLTCGRRALRVLRALDPHECQAAPLPCADGCAWGVSRAVFNVCGLMTTNSFKSTIIIDTFIKCF